MLGSIIILSLAMILFWIWSIIDCIRSDISTEDKLIWVLMIVFLNLLGSLLYLILSKIMGVRMVNNMKGKKLYRSKSNRMISGVCGGLGEYLGIDTSIIRIIWVLVTLFTGIFTGVIVYVVFALVIPEKPKGVLGSKNVKNNSSVSSSKTVKKKLSKKKKAKSKSSSKKK